MKKLILSMGVSAVLVLSGCATNPNNEDVGMVVGGMLGGALASRIGHGNGRIAATVIGTLLGAAIGGSIGRSLDEVDRMQVARALEHSPSHRRTMWRNPNSGIQYTVTPRRTYQTASQRYCREYTIKAVIGGTHQQVYGTACRQPDGSWRVIS